MVFFNRGLDVKLDPNHTMKLFGVAFARGVAAVARRCDRKGEQTMREYQAPEVVEYPVLTDVTGGSPLD